MNQQPLDCLAVVQQLWDYLDRELNPAADAAMRDHLATCTGCASHVAFCRSFLENVRNVPVNEGSLAGLRQRVSAALQQQA